MIANNPYKGFEAWWNSLRMTAKMHMYVIGIFVVIQLISLILIDYFFYGYWYEELFKYLFACLKFKTIPNGAIVNEYLRFIVIENVCAFVGLGIVSTFLYPIAIGKFKAKAAQQTSTKYISGADLLDTKEFIKQIGEGDLPIGSFRLPVKEETKHLITVGRPGTGKTVFLSQVVERLIQRQNKAIIYDFKGDYTERFYKPGRDILFNPLDERSIGWCVFSDIKSKLDINNVAASLIPQTQRGEDFWNEGARSVLAGILHYLWQSEAKTNRHIWTALTAKSEKISEWLNNIPEGKKGYRYIEDPSSKQALGVLSTMIQYCAVFEYMKDREEIFSITDWLSNGKPGFIYVTNQADVAATLRPILSLFIDLLGKKLLSMSDDLQKRIFFILDEFGTLQRLSSITELLAASRSKGGSIWIGIQDIGQIRKLYSSDMASTIVNACGTSVMFAVADPDTAQYLVRKVGDTEILESEETISMGPRDYKDGLSMSQRRKRQSLLMNSQLMNLPDLQAYTKVPNNPFITLTKFQIKAYQKKEIPFIISTDLILENVIQKQQDIQADSENNIDIDMIMEA